MLGKRWPIGTGLVNESATGSVKIYKSERKWSERRDLNSGPPVPQTGALTGLRYAPKLLDSWLVGFAASTISVSRNREAIAEVCTIN